MKIRNNIRRSLYLVGVVLTFSLGLLLGGCDSDEEHGKQERLRELHFVLSGRSFGDMTVTRALPTGYKTYSDLYPQQLPEHAKILGYLTRSDSEKMLTGIFSFSDSGVNNRDRNWTSSIHMNEGTYYIYGFMPQEDANSVSIAPYDADNTPGNDSYSDGAVITVTDLAAITPADISVIVGVKSHTNGTDPITSLDMASRMGKFDYTTQPDGDYIYLLIDHIYAGLNFEMKVDAEYNKLRHIKLKKLLLMDVSSDNVVKSVNATITLVANNAQKNPLSAEAGGSILITTNRTGVMTDDEAAVLWDNETSPAELTTTATSFLGCFAPGGSRNFLLKSVYDVYDTNDNLVRENQTALNSITNLPALKAGEKYTISLTVKPTYLYKMSDPDLDNPTVSVTATSPTP